MSSVVSVSRALGSAPFRDGEVRPGPFSVCACALPSALAATAPSSDDDGFLLRLWPFVVAMRSPLAPPAGRARGRVADSMLVPRGGTRYQAAVPPRSCAELYRTAPSRPWRQRITARRAGLVPCRTAA